VLQRSGKLRTPEQAAEDMLSALIDAPPMKVNTHQQ